MRRATSLPRSAGMLLAAVLLAAPVLHAAPGDVLELTNLHTGEVLSLHLDAPELAPAQAAQMQHLLRDYRANEEHAMDAGLFPQLIEFARTAGCAPKYEVISGYRSPGTNARLHAAGHHVAEHSLHMQGRAIDVRLKQCPLSRLRDVALAARRGGVGYYPQSNFVHIDTGGIRSWQE